MKQTSRRARKRAATSKPIFGDFLRDQQNRSDFVGDLAREAQASHFGGSTITEMWDHLEQLDLMDTFTPAMTQAEQEYNVLVLGWETKLRARVHMKSIVSGGLPGLGRR